MTSMKLLGLIVARGKSEGLPEKHLQVLSGKRVIEHVIDYAKNETCFDALALSSDSPDLLAIARERGVTAIERPPEHAKDDAPLSGALVHAFQQLKESEGRTFDAVSVLFGCVPSRPQGAMEKCFGILKETGATAVRSYCPVWKFHPDWLVSIEDGKVRKFIDGDNHRRQEMRPLYFPDGGIIVVRADVVEQTELEDGYDPDFLGDDVRGVVFDFPSAVEIDDKFDLDFAEWALSTRRLPEKGKQ